MVVGLVLVAGLYELSIMLDLRTVQMLLRTATGPLSRHPRTVCRHGAVQPASECQRDAAWPRQFAEATRELIENADLALAVGRGGRALRIGRPG